MEERRWLGKGCGPRETKGCCLQICSEQSGTGGEVWERGHVGSWASCGERLQGSLGCWMLGSSGRKCLWGGEEIDMNMYYIISKEELEF